MSASLQRGKRWKADINFIIFMQTNNMQLNSGIVENFTESFLKKHCNIPEDIQAPKIVDRTNQKYCVEYYGGGGLGCSLNIRFYHQYANRLRLEIQTYEEEWTEWHDVISYPCARTASEIGHGYGDIDSEAYSTEHLADSAMFEGEKYIVLTCFDGDDCVWAVYSVENEVNFIV